MLGRISRKKAEKIIGQTIRPDHAEEKMVINSTEKGIELTGKSKDDKKYCFYGFPHYTPKAKALRKAVKK